MTTERVSSGDVTLVVDVQGEGQPILLLHGWPDTAALWRAVTPHLVEAGFQVIAPDLRGCGRSDKPGAVEDYRMHLLVADVAAVIGSLAGGRSHLVGHDLGANLAWVTAAYLPAQVDRLVALSVGHPTSFFADNISQQIRSLYILLFEHPGIAEEWLLRDDARALRHWTGHPDADSVLADIERNGSLTTHLNWYRANITARNWVSAPPTLPAIAAPTLGIWSTNDLALTREQMTASADHCSNGFEFEQLEGPGHWIPLDAPEVLADRLVRFLAAR
jgi:pimeloyl-ACP methyl ester carboxylesterase